MSDNPDADAALIERDIDRTQDRMGNTVQKLEKKLTPGELARSFVGQDKSEAVKQAVDVAKRNPVAVALIAIGAVWLLASHRSRNAIGRVLKGRNRPARGRAA